MRRKIPLFHRPTNYSLDRAMRFSFLRTHYTIVQNKEIARFFIKFLRTASPTSYTSKRSARASALFNRANPALV